MYILYDGRFSNQNAYKKKHLSIQYVILIRKSDSTSEFASAAQSWTVTAEKILNYRHLLCLP
uniref:Uncharacterized protein n=1 Tax=Physcomitrium patens TaxID=3218 RepID=A0A2K1JBR4_PHYPA|nr:hypothetical protein PHYPA_019235 [Physcomitrium patens]